MVKGKILWLALTESMTQNHFQMDFLIMLELVFMFKVLQLAQLTPLILQQVLHFKNAELSIWVVNYQKVCLKKSCLWQCKRILKNGKVYSLKFDENNFS